MVIDNYWVKLLRIATLVACISILSSCDSGVIAKKELASGCWAVTDVLSTELVASDPNTQLFVDLELGEDYPYQNIYLKISWEGPQGSGDTLLNEILLTPTGDWLAPVSRGSVRWSMETGIHLSKGMSPSKVAVQHFMRDDELCDIRSISLRLGA